MPVKQNIPYAEGIFFITITCYKWLPLIELTNSYDAVYKWFDYLKSKGHYVTGYVIMPNHLHALIAFRNTGKSINKIIGDGKRFLAYEIIKQLKERGNEALIRQLQNAVEAKDQQRNKQHEVWSDSFDWKECRNRKFINQKLEYMHSNPCAGKWKLAVSPLGYKHSSAVFYATGVVSNFAITNVAELDDVDLTRGI